MSHDPWRPEPHKSRRTRLQSCVRRAAIGAAALICLAAVGGRADAGIGPDGPQSSWVMNWLAPVQGTTRLLNTFEAMSSWSDASVDAVSLFVLGLSLVGGGRVIRRLRLRAAHHPRSADCAKASRSPMAAEQIGPRRLAR